MRNKKYLFGILTGVVLLGILGAKITSNVLQLGRNVAEDISINFETGSANPPQIKWDNAGSALKFSSNGTDFFNFGSGSGSGTGVTFIENGDFEQLNITGWSTYADVAASTPADGTGGTPNITVSFNNSTPLNGDGQLRISKDAVNRQGEGISYPFTVPPGYRQGQKSGISFLVDASTANYTAGDLAVYVYDVTNSTLITPTVAAIPKAKTPISIAWDQTTGTDFRLIFHVTSTNATAYDVYLDDVVIGPKFPGQLPVTSEWIAYTPTITSGFTLGNGTQEWYWKRSGDSMEIRGKIIFGSTSSISGTPIWQLPTGYTIDTAKIATPDNNYAQLGSAFGLDATGPTNAAALVYQNAASTNGFYPASALNSGNAWSATVPWTWATNDWLMFDIKVPIAEWTGNTSYVGQNNVEYACSTTGTWDAAATASNTVYGPDGCPITGALTAARTKSVRFQTPVQFTDKVELQYKDTNGKWINSGDTIGQFLALPAIDFGARWRSSATQTDVDVEFQRYYAPGSTYNAGPGGDWTSAQLQRWRVVKMAGGNTVGFGLADSAGNSGLVNPYVAGSGVVYSGTYTPSGFNNNGTTTVTPTTAFYYRVGSIVTVFVRGTVLTTNDGSTTIRFDLTLPVASNLAGNDDLIGSGKLHFTSTEDTVHVYGNGTSDRATVEFNHSSAAITYNYNLSFSYVIK